MKLRYYIIAATLTIAALLPVITAAKNNNVPQRVYMFGFAASFNDTIVHFTEIQAVDSVMLDGKHQFLMFRNQYSNQLSSYLAQQQMPLRTCVVFYNKNVNKLQKKFLKMKKLYSSSKNSRGSNEVRTITSNDFKFKPFWIETSESIDETTQP